MTVGDLSRLLYDLDVPPTLYRLDGSHFELAHVIAREGEDWVVFLSERGERSGTIEFASEHDACVYLLGSVALQLARRDMLALHRDEPHVGGHSGTLAQASELGLGRTVLRPLPWPDKCIDGQHKKHKTDQPSLQTPGDHCRHRDHAKQDRASDATKDVESVEKTLDQPASNVRRSGVIPEHWPRRGPASSQRTGRPG
jgi:hypothetical protein